MKTLFKKYRPDTLGGVLLHLSVAVVVLLIVVGVYFFLYLPGATNHGETITVPEIIGMEINKLEEHLGQRDLRYEVSDSSYSADYPPLTVLKQYPHAGAKVKEGRKIFISVNRVNPPTVPVPNLVDGSVLNADAMLKSNELKRGRITVVRGPFNVVKEMRMGGAKIEPGVKVPKGSVIDLIVMDGGSTEFPIEDLTGLEFEEAKVYLLGVVLNIGQVEVIGDTVGELPVILKQMPAPGENIRVGDVVDLWVGKPGTAISDELLTTDDEETE